MSNTEPTSSAATTVTVIDGARVTADASGQPTAAPNPKIVAGAVTSVGLLVVVAVLAAVTPDMLTGLGAWGVLIYAGLVALGQALGGYIKRP